MHLGHWVLIISSVTTDIEMILAQVVLLNLIQLRPEFGRVALVAVAEIRLGKIVALRLQDALWSRIADIEVTRFDRSDEVFVRWLHCTVWIPA